MILDNATVYPISSKGKGGVLHDGNFLLESRRLWHIGEKYLPKTSRPTIVLPNEEIVEDAFFAGYLIGHFGHFLLESLSRIKYFKDHQTLIWLHDRYGRGCKLKKWQEEIFALLGLESHHHIICKKPTLVKKLHFFKPDVYFPISYNSDFFDRVGKFVAGDQVAGKKIWLSRKKYEFKKRSMLLNESIPDGCKVIYPEDLSITQLLQEMSSSEFILGHQGSAFHALILLDRVNARVKITPRNGRIQNYIRIAELKGFQQSFEDNSEQYNRFLLL